jgi:hypothetical protein
MSTNVKNSGQKHADMFSYVNAAFFMDFSSKINSQLSILS